jgi:uncharacterized membrane protein YtjA (UPF0391 family)
MLPMIDDRSIANSRRRLDSELFEFGLFLTFIETFPALWNSVCDIPKSFGNQPILQKLSKLLFRSGIMLSWALTFFVLALIAAIFGFGGIAAGAAEIAKILFILFLVLFVISLFTGAIRKKDVV